MLMASYVLNKATCTSKSLETFLGDMNLQMFCAFMSFYKSSNFDF